MTKGTLSAASWRRKLLAFVLVAVIAICAALLAFASPSKTWTVTLQVGSAVAGAALGSILQSDALSANVVSQISKSIRRLFDQAARLYTLVEKVERRAIFLREDDNFGTLTERERIADWLEDTGGLLRQEIDSVAASIDDWGDLSHETYTSELELYQSRKERMPKQAPNKEARG